MRALYAFGSSDRVLCVSAYHPPSQTPFFSLLPTHTTRPLSLSSSDAAALQLARSTAVPALAAAAGALATARASAAALSAALAALRGVAGAAADDASLPRWRAALAAFDAAVASSSASLTALETDARSLVSALPVVQVREGNGGPTASFPQQDYYGG